MEKKKKRKERISMWKHGQEHFILTSERNKLSSLFLRENHFPNVMYKF